MLLPLGLTVVMGVGIFLIPPAGEAEQPGAVVRKRPQIMPAVSAPGTFKAASHPELKAEPKPVPPPLTTEEKEQAAVQRAQELSKMFIRYMPSQRRRPVDTALCGLPLLRS